METEPTITEPSQEIIPTENTLVKVLAPEDIQVGDVVAVLYASREVRQLEWNWIPNAKAMRVSHIPCDGGTPQRVEAICLPFVLVKHPNGHVRSLDVRICQIARLSPSYADIAWRAHKRRFRQRRPDSIPE